MAIFPEENRARLLVPQIDHERLVVGEARRLAIVHAHGVVEETAPRTGEGAIADRAGESGMAAMLFVEGFVGGG